MNWITLVMVVPLSLITGADVKAGAGKKPLFDDDDTKPLGGWSVAPDAP